MSHLEQLQSALAIKLQNEWGVLQKLVDEIKKDDDKGETYETK